MADHERAEVPGRDFDLYDESFKPLSFHDDNGKLVGIDLELVREGRVYLLTILTMDQHMALVALEDGTGDEYEYNDDHTVVVAADELLPSELAKYKAMSFEELRPFLEEQAD